ncbi:MULTISPECIES: hypothetical protein [unclassified Janthinobacterium]|uniref:hypothetical protein n=1 Tax=unclassified Janthinobacterium TaxID=2610881 RepID=UPI00034C0D2B|nr:MULTISPECIES: hypothetical protein [unclassified Janthinobacterium]MEC5164210.1 N-acyl-L-homoserine lactone synthetase [Janthinobacterium sp. CG_S6]
MSNIGGTAAHGAADAAAAARIVRQADDGIGDWLGGLVSGKGTSPSQIILTGVLGLVPGLGQAMDARDLIFGLILVAKSPASIIGWIELVITLIGCVPGAGDTLKVSFKLMQQGHSFGRVLEAVSPKVRGNVEAYMRNINWKNLAGECKGLLNKTFAAFIDGLDSWAVKALTSRSQVKEVIGELKSLQQRAPKMIDEVFAELKNLHAKMLGHELPGTTAALAGTSGKAAKVEAREVVTATATKQARALSKKEKRLLAKKNRDVKENHVTPYTTKVDQKKAAQKNRNRNKQAVIAEHLTDYFVKKKHTIFNKVNNNGKLTEEKSVMHTGIDHLWANSTDIAKPFVVGDTKSSILDAFKLMAALPTEWQEKFNVLRADEAAVPLKNGKPNIFDSEARDAHQSTQVKNFSLKVERNTIKSLTCQ